MELQSHLSCWVRQGFADCSPVYGSVRHDAEGRLGLLRASGQAFGSCVSSLLGLLASVICVSREGEDVKLITVKGNF